MKNTIIFTGPLLLGLFVPSLWGLPQVVSNSGSAQAQPVSAQLQEAKSLKELEHNLVGALALYTQVANDPAAKPAERRVASLNAGKLHRELGDESKARAAFAQAGEGEDATAKEARAALAQDDVGAERAQVLHRQAEAALVRLREEWSGGGTSARARRGPQFGLWSPAADDLLWLGAASVPVVRAEIDLCLKNEAKWEPLDDGERLMSFVSTIPALVQKKVKNASDARRQAEKYRSLLAAILWRIGDASALKYLETLHQSDNRLEQRCPSLGLGQCEKLAAPAQKLALRFMGDRRNAGEIGSLTIANAALSRSAQGGDSLISEMPLRDFAALLHTGEPAIQIRVLLSLAGYSYRVEEIVEGGIHDPLRFALSSDHPGVHQEALGVLARWGLTTPGLRILMMEQWLTLPLDNNIRWAGPREKTMQYSDREAELLVQCIQRVGPYVEKELPNGKGSLWEGISQLATQYAYAWDERGLEALLLADRFSYLDLNATADLLRRLELKGRMASVIQWMDGSPNLPFLLEYLPWEEIDPSALPVLVELEKRLRENRDATGDGKQARLHWRQSVRLIGSVSSDDAVDALVEIASLDAAGYVAAGEHLARLGLNYDSPRVAQALGEILDRKVEGGPRGVQAARSGILRTVMQRNDEATLERIAEWGVHNFAQVEYFYDKKKFQSNRGSHEEYFGVLPWLTYQERDPGQSTKYRNVAGEARRLLQASPESKARIFESIYGSQELMKKLRPNDRFEALTNSSDAPWADYPAYFGQILGYWESVIVDEVANPSDSIQDSFQTLMWSRSNLGEMELRDTEEESLFQRLNGLALVVLEGKNASYVNPVLDSLAQVGMEDSWKPKVLAWSGHSVTAKRFVSSFVVSNIALTEAEYRGISDNATQYVQVEALRQMRRLAPSGTAEWVIPFLSSKEGGVRVQACERLGVMLDKRAVRPLLGALGDPHLGVRKAAKEALEKIRYYYDEQERWNRFFQEVKLDGQSAAEALLKQAQPDQAKKKRLVAIRSLGKLGKPEALPFLIEWSQSNIGEIAVAASAAIEQILSTE